MYYKNLLISMINSEKNPVNKMYLHEIQMKWDKFLEAAKQPTQENSEIVLALNIFLEKLSQKKFQYNPRSKQGFKIDSSLYKPYYLNDLISMIISRNNILKRNGIIWDFVPFNINIGFNPNDLGSIEKNPQYVQSYSKTFLQLAQKLEIQIRVFGKRNFHKYELKLPLIVFHTFKNLTEENFSQCEFSANQANSTFQKSKSIIITETLEKDFFPDIKSSSVDAVFVLKKSYSNMGKVELSADVIDAIEREIKKYLTNQKDTEGFQKTGIIN